MLARRAHEIWQQLLADYEPPAMDPAIDEALKEYVVKREEALRSAEAIER